MKNVIQAFLILIVYIIMPLIKLEASWGPTSRLSEKIKKETVKPLPAGCKLLIENINQATVQGNTPEINKYIDQIEKNYGKDGLLGLYADEGFEFAAKFDSVVQNIRSDVKERIQKLSVVQQRQETISRPARPLPRPPAIVAPKPSEQVEITHEVIGKRRTQKEADLDRLAKTLQEKGIPVEIRQGELWLKNEVGFNGPRTQQRTGKQDLLVKDASYLSPEYTLGPEYSPESWPIFKKLVLRYKIHLMPKDEDIVDVVLRLCTLIKKYPALQQGISDLKIIPVLEGNMLPEWQKLPKIVVYVDTGKANAQNVLDIIYNEFKGMHGLKRSPRYNEKVTDLIYFAQGNGDDKGDNKPNDCFEQPDRVYYKSDVTGIHQDYHLKNPATKK